MKQQQKSREIRSFKGLDCSEDLCIVYLMIQNSLWYVDLMDLTALSMHRDQWNLEASVSQGAVLHECDIKSYFLADLKRGQFFTIRGNS